MTRQEFDEAFDRLAASGMPMKADRDQAWRDFAGWRVNYDKALISICRMILAPPAQWSSDRYPDGHFKPSFFPERRERRRQAAGTQD